MVPETMYIDIDVVLDGLREKRDFYADERKKNILKQVMPEQPTRSRKEEEQ